LELLSS